MKDTEYNYKGIFHKKIARLSSINLRFHRISSMLLDHVIMTLVIVLPWFLIILLIISDLIKLNLNHPFLEYFSIFMMFIYLNKDFFNAKSPAKRILGYQVINRKTEKPASELQCFIRNLTITIAWPLEVIVGYLNPKRRIGDYLANTKVITSEKEKLKSIFTDLKIKKLKLNFLLILIIGVVYFYFLSLLFPNMT